MAEKKNEQEATENVETADADSASTAQPKKKGKLLGAIVTPLILAAVSFGTVYLLPTSEGTIVPASQDEGAAAVTSPHDFMPTNLAIVEMDEFVVSIRDDKNILRMRLALEVPTDLQSEIEANDLRLRDAFMGYIRAIEVAELNDPAFLPQLRSQLLRRARLVLGPDKVAGVLITDFLIR